MPVWKPVGASTHIISAQISEKLDVKTAHTGTLDPIAEGVIIILTGDEIKNKKRLAEWKKFYEFEVVFGLTTDTFDALGIVNFIENNPKKILKKELDGVLIRFVGKYKQTVPSYSAIKIKGKPLHWYARNNKINEIKLPSREGFIYDARVVTLKKVSREKLLNEIITDVKKVEGDLRQDEIIKRWEQVLGRNAPTEFQVAKIRVETSKGLYVRSLSQDIAEKLNTVGFVHNLVRTKNGKYSKKDCETIKSLDLRPLGNN